MGLQLQSSSRLILRSKKMIGTWYIDHTREDVTRGQTDKTRNLKKPNLFWLEPYDAVYT